MASLYWHKRFRGARRLILTAQRAGDAGAGPGKWRSPRGQCLIFAPQLRNFFHVGALTLQHRHVARLKAVPAMRPRGLDDMSASVIRRRRAPRLWPMMAKVLQQHLEAGRGFLRTGALPNVHGDDECPPPGRGRCDGRRHHQAPSTYSYPKSAPAGTRRHLGGGRRRAPPCRCCRCRNHSACAALQGWCRRWRSWRGRFSMGCGCHTPFDVVLRALALE